MTSKPLSAPLYVNPRKAAELAGVSPRTVLNWCYRYEESGGQEGLVSRLIRGRSGRRGNRLIKLSDLIEFIENHTVTPK